MDTIFEPMMVHHLLGHAICVSNSPQTGDLARTCHDHAESDGDEVQSVSNCRALDFMVECRSYERRLDI